MKASERGRFLAFQNDREKRLSPPRRFESDLRLQKTVVPERLHPSAGSNSVREHIFIRAIRPVPPNAKAAKISIAIVEVLPGPS